MCLFVFQEAHVFTRTEEVRDIQSHKHAYHHVLWNPMCLKRRMPPVDKRQEANRRLWCQSQTLSEPRRWHFAGEDWLSLLIWAVQRVGVKVIWELYSAMINQQIHNYFYKRFILTWAGRRANRDGLCSNTPAPLMLKYNLFNLHRNVKAAN